MSGPSASPAKSTVHAVLARHGRVKRGGGPRQPRAAPNELWCAARNSVNHRAFAVNHAHPSEHGPHHRRASGHASA